MYTYWLNYKTRNIIISKLNLWYLNTIRQYQLLNIADLLLLISNLQSPTTIRIKTAKPYYNFYTLYTQLLALLLILIIIYMLILFI